MFMCMYMYVCIYIYIYIYIYMHIHKSIITRKWHGPGVKTWLDTGAFENCGSLSPLVQALYMAGSYEAWEMLGPPGGQDQIFVQSQITQE